MGLHLSIPCLAVDFWLLFFHVSNHVRCVEICLMDFTWRIRLSWIKFDIQIYPVFRDDGPNIWVPGEALVQLRESLDQNKQFPPPPSFLPLSPPFSLTLPSIFPRSFPFFPFLLSFLPPLLHFSLLLTPSPPLLSPPHTYLRPLFQTMVLEWCAYKFKRILKNLSNSMKSAKLFVCIFIIYSVIF